VFERFLALFPAVCTATVSALAEAAWLQAKEGFAYIKP
jgi:hypothetical protein